MCSRQYLPVVDLSRTASSETGLLGNGGKLGVEFVAVDLGGAKGCGFAADLEVAEEAGEGLAVAVAPDEPAVGAAGVDATDAFEGGTFRWHESVGLRVTGGKQWLDLITSV